MPAGARLATMRDALGRRFQETKRFTEQQTSESAVSFLLPNTQPWSMPPPTSPAGEHRVNPSLRPDSRYLGSPPVPPAGEHRVNPSLRLDP
ncbi:hypothetical protein E2562_016330 [Oryza meyeriana var. granulata]|uniref:Uncharacterized protein n=1 Tax=Oryza meyeriana var. granulata TaxID=110450 RepID=A0A6G1DWZ0_9ORYZ|nr:hypothetical protein E2562_016330 [Oryza meyeriana var. granulata]